MWSSSTKKVATTTRIKPRALFPALMILCLIAHKKIDVSASSAAAATTVESRDLERRSEASSHLVNTHSHHDNWKEHDDASPHHVEGSDVIIVVAVDGTLAGLDRNSGQILWKQNGSASTESSSSASGGLLSKASNNMQRAQTASDIATSDASSGGDGDSKEGAASKGWKPLVSTSTTTQSQRKYQWKTTAVPSVDGRVFLGPPGEETQTFSVAQLVDRSPFLDLRGRFHVGSTVRSATAIDGMTGEILRTVGDPNEKTTSSLHQTFEGRNNVVWLGRVDHSVTIHDARTGSTDVEFGVSNLMTMSDMAKLSSTAEQGPSKSPNQHLFLPGAFDNAIDEPSKLLATPGGSIAYRNPNTGSVDWVAPESFNTPIVFAMDSRTGESLGVDMLPDAPMPDASLEVIARSLKRQIERLEYGHESDMESDPTIVGAMASGQLFAMPLGKRKSYLPSLPTTPTHPAIASTSAANSNRAQYQARVPQLGGSHRQHISSGRSQDGSNLQRYQHQNPETKHLPYMTSKPCNPSSPYYPGCLVGQRYQQYQNYARRGDGFESESSADNGRNIVRRPDNLNSDPRIYQYHPELGYNEEYFLHYQQQQRRNYNQVLRILGSWLAPTVALIFVVSFELGRRKRQQDEAELEASRAHETLDEKLKKSGEFVPIPDDRKDTQQHVIQVSDQVLGYGGHGTVVFKGMLDGRSVAVKRMLQVYHASADREISLLIESDGHPNVVRYFLKEVRGDFVYLALELCDLSLHDLIGTLRSHENEKTDEVSKSTKKILLQVASGVKHLHSLRIVHRDLKPANILLGSVNQRKSSKAATDDTYKAFLEDKYVAKISDMGLGKQLTGQSSFGMSTLGASTIQGQSETGGSVAGVGPGSVGWQAPEVMSSRLSSESSVRSSEGNSTSLVEASPTDTSPNPRTSRSVDVFSLGCIFYSALVPGAHPFGEWYEREANIMHNRPNLDALEKMSPDAHNLVASMISRNPKMRPTAKQLCDHPFFWTSHQKLAFLCDFSDRLEADASDDTTLSGNAAKVLMTNPLAIERCAGDIVGTAWDKLLDPVLIVNVQKFRTYDTTSVRDLLRLIRNKYHHFDELPPDFRASIGSTQEGLLDYFETRFPRLMMHCFNLCRQMLPSGDPLAAKYSIPPSCQNSASKYVGPAKTLSETKSSNGSVNGNEFSKDALMDDSADEEDMATLPSIENTNKDQNENGAPLEPKSSTDVITLDHNGGITLDHNGGNTLPVLQDELSSLPPSKEEKGEEITLIATQENGMPNDDTEGPQTAPANSLISSNAAVLTNDEDIVIWEQSTAAKSLNCRGWIRSDEEWTRRVPTKKKIPPELQRCVEEPKFRTRLCNHWDVSLGCHCPMRRKNKCVFAHGPVELRVKEPKKGRWGKLVDKNGNNSNPRHSGGEDTYGAARSIETVRKEEGKWNTTTNGGGKNGNQNKSGTANKGKKQAPSGGGGGGKKKPQQNAAAVAS